MSQQYYIIRSDIYIIYTYNGTVFISGPIDKVEQEIKWFLQIVFNPTVHTVSRCVPNISSQTFISYLILTLYIISYIEQSIWFYNIYTYVVQYTRLSRANSRGNSFLLMASNLKTNKFCKSTVLQYVLFNFMWKKRILKPIYYLS